MGTLQSLYVESVSETDIKVSVKQPVEGWIVGEIKPEVCVCFSTERPVTFNKFYNHKIPYSLTKYGLQVCRIVVSIINAKHMYKKEAKQIFHKRKC